jgi:hypothetical protein
MNMVAATETSLGMYRLGRLYTGGTVDRLEGGQTPISEFSIEHLPTTMTQSQETDSTADIVELFATIRRYGQEQGLSVLELIAQYAIDDLPMSIGYQIKDYVEAHKPKVKPGQVKYRKFFSSGRSDISERMEEIIYGPEEPGDDE